MGNLSYSYNFDIHKAIDSVVSISAYIPENSFSAELLGTDRSGHGIIIDDDGLLLTIGYVITEAESIWITPHGQDPVQGYVVGNDFESGLGLIKPVRPLNLPKMDFGTVSKLNQGDKVILADSTGISTLAESKVITIKEFAGRWEYLLDQAIYTSPVHSNWAGSALIGQDGLLYGVGCLLIQDVEAEKEISAYNMFVPTDMIQPYISEIKVFGRRKKAPRPWLGMLVQEEDDVLVVTGIFTGCPADQAGLQLGDVITHVGNAPVSHLKDLFTEIWKLGDAGVEVPLTFVRDGGEYQLAAVSSDRESSFIRGPVN